MNTNRLSISTCVFVAGTLLCAASIASEVHAQTASPAISAGANDTANRQGNQGIPGVVSGGGIGGPASVPAQIREERLSGPKYRFPGFDQTLEPWMEFKEQVADEQRLLVGTDYTSLYQRVSATPTGNNVAASGIYRVFADWTLFGENEKNAGSLIFKAEHRRDFGTEVAPAGLGFDAGYLGIPGTLFNDSGWFVSNLYWEQFLFDGQAGLVVGRVEPDSFVDVSGYANPWTTFQNFGILVNSTIPFPDPGFGVAGGVVCNDQWRVKAGLYDANAKATEIGLFRDGEEFFTHVDVSWAPSMEERYLKEFHVTVWHVDKREMAGVPESHGVAIAGNWTFEEKWMPFFRAGWSEGEAPLMKRAVTGGILRYCTERGDLAGVGASWEDPANESLREQSTVELFYRLQFAKHLAVTPSVQIISNPAQNLNEDVISIFGLRGRVTF